MNWKMAAGYIPPYDVLVDAYAYARRHGYMLPGELEQNISECMRSDLQEEQVKRDWELAQRLQQDEDMLEPQAPTSPVAGVGKAPASKKTLYDQLESLDPTDAGGMRVSETGPRKGGIYLVGDEYDPSDMVNHLVSSPLRPPAIAGPSSAADNAAPHVPQRNLIVVHPDDINKWLRHLHSPGNDETLLLIFQYGSEFLQNDYNDMLDQADVVLITYETLGVLSILPGGKGFFSVPWRRVILDKAYIICNRNSRARSAVLSLQTTYRWCILSKSIVGNALVLSSCVGFLEAAIN